MFELHNKELISIEEILNPSFDTVCNTPVIDMARVIVARVFALLKAAFLEEMLRLTEEWEYFQLLLLNRPFAEHRMG